jgi:hypothetical protein
MTRALRSPRRNAAALLLILVAALSGPAPVLGQTEPEEPAAPAASTILTQDGWWNRAQGAQEGEPSTPIRPAIGGLVPAPSTVPANGLGVGAVLGEPDKVAAVGLLLEGPPDLFVDKLTLQLQELTTSGATANAAAAKILACPITSFWASAKNGEFATRPVCDESQSVVGERSAEGVWTFDLTLLASSWVDPSTGLSQNGVLLREAVDAPVSFQVSLGDLSTNTIKTDLQVTDFGAPAEFSFDDTSTDVAADFSDAESTFTGTEDGAFVTDTGPAFDASTTVAPVDAEAPTSPASAAVSSATASSGTAAPIAATPNLFGQLPVAALLFLALLVLGAAVFLGLVLGPLASPGAGPGGARAARHGGVSRALAAREAATSTSKGIF